jgi:DNA-binding NarL/FixJ family response regulator
MRDSLRALLRAIPQVRVIGQVEDGPSALKMLIEHCPSLVLLASNLPGDGAWGVLKQTKAEQPQTRCLVLADTIHQQCKAEAAGADSVLLAGFPATKFFATIEELLSVPVESKTMVN